MRRDLDVLPDHELRQIPITAFFTAMAVLLPQLFHVIGLGPAFLPMFLPVMMGSMLLSWKFALALAVIAPLVSWGFTGMPPLVPPVLPVILAELTAISLILSLLHVHLKRPVWLALLLAITADRLLLFALIYLVAPLFGLKGPFFSLSLVLVGIPGIVIQILVIPAALKLIDQKFPHYFEFGDSNEV